MRRGSSALSTTLVAQTVKVEGPIKSRNGDTMTLQTSDSPNLVVLLTDSTQVGQVQGVFKARRKEMSMGALIPGLAVKVEGTYNDQKQLEAKSVAFKDDDLQQAEELAKQQAALQQQQAQPTEPQQKIAANNAAIDGAVARFVQLDILDETTVYFGNGQVKVDPKYTPQLLALAEKAKTINGYMIEVKGYASSVGSVALNQQLSEDRANDVTNILLQQGHVPLTRMSAQVQWERATKLATTRQRKGRRRIVVWSCAFCRKLSPESKEQSLAFQPVRSQIIRRA